MDERFSELFRNPDFEFEKDSEQYQQISERLRKHREAHGDGRDYSEDEFDDEVSLDCFVLYSII